MDEQKPTDKQEPTDKSPDANSYNEQGRVLAEQGEYDRAIEQYKLAVARDPKFYFAYYNWGLALYNLKQYDDAIKQFIETLKINDKYSHAHNGWGLALAGQENYDGAIEKYKLAISYDAKFYWAYYNWGLALFNQKKYEKAIEKFAEAIKINDKYADAYNGWGLALARQENYDGAIEKYQLAISYDAKYFLGYYNWGLALFNQKKYDEAIEKFTEATKINDKYADTYNDWGNALAAEKKYDESIEKYNLAISVNSKHPGAYRNWGLALAGLRQYEAAIEKYGESIKLIRANGVESEQIWATYGRHNIAELIWRQGRYKEARKEWEDTQQAYIKTREIARKAGTVDYFLYFGSVLQSVLADSSGAESAFEEGLKLDPNHVGILTNLVGLYIQQKDNSTEKLKPSLLSLLKEDEDPDQLPATSCYWKARECFVRARAIQEARLNQGGNDDVFAQLGQLFLALGGYLTTEEYERAESSLLTAFEKNKESSTVCASLGVLYARLENYQKAVQYLGDAVKLEPDDLTMRSSLAEAHLKAGSMERAEAEYKRVLDVTQYHVESHIGLGEIYKAMGDADDDGDMYYRAIQEFSEGLRIAGTESGSKKLTGKNFAAACYSRGYARVKLYEVTKLARDESLLNKARADFRRARDNDSEHYKAARALEKIGKRFGFRAAQRLIEKLGPWILFSLSLSVFGFAQASFFFGKFRVKDAEPLLNAGYYVLLTFGSLIWMVASISLPQLLKLKVAGIELEKSAVDQITTPTALEISR